MEQLRSRDFLAALDFLQEIHSFQSPQSFVPGLLSSLPKLVASEVTSYNEMEFSRGRSIDWVFPERIRSANRGAVWKRLMHEHPVVNHFQHSRDSGCVRLSDLVSSREFHRTNLYHEFYRAMQVEDILAFMFTASDGLAIGIALHRKGKFSERDRQLLERARPHIIQQHNNARSAARRMREAETLGIALESMSGGMITIDRERRITSVSALGQRCLEEYFDGPMAADRLPETLDLWVRYHNDKLRHTLKSPAPVEPLVIHLHGKSLAIRMLPRRRDTVLLLEERLSSVEPAVLAALGLTRRETEVLAQAMTGKSNVEIGLAIGMSPRTVQTHLARVYERLGVNSRTGAAAIAMRATQSAARVQSLARFSVREE